MKIFVDDLHTPGGLWVIARTAKQAIQLITNNIEAVSLDHDLNDGDDGIAVAKFIEEQAYYDRLEPIPHINLHTDNPVGRENMKAAIESAIRYWGRNYTIKIKLTIISRGEMGISLI